MLSCSRCLVQQIVSLRVAVLFTLGEKEKKKEEMKEGKEGRKKKESKKERKERLKI